MILDILNAIFGATKYKYRVVKSDGTASVIEAVDFNEASNMVRNRYSMIVPLEDVVGTKGARGANTNEYIVTSTMSVLASNSAHATSQFASQVTAKQAYVTKVGLPILVNEDLMI